MRPSSSQMHGRESRWLFGFYFGALLESTLGKAGKKVKVNGTAQWANEWNNKIIQKSVPWSWLIVLHFFFMWNFHLHTSVHVVFKSIHYHLLFNESTDSLMHDQIAFAYLKWTLHKLKMKTQTKAIKIAPFHVLLKVFFFSLFRMQ